MKTPNVVAPNFFPPSLIIPAGRGRTERESEFLPLPHQARCRRKEQGCIRALRSILTELYSEETGVQPVWGVCRRVIVITARLSWHPDLQLRTLPGCTKPGWESGPGFGDESLSTGGHIVSSSLQLWSRSHSH